MMAIERKQLNSGERVWLDGAGKPYPMPDKAIRLDEQRRLDAELLDAAGMEVTGERRWFAFRTAHRSEIEIRDSLVKMKVDAVVPVKKVHVVGRRAGARGRVVHKSVLTNLVFVRMVSSDAAVAGLLRVRGVDAVIGSQGRPHPIGDREMNAFMDLAEKGAFDERNTPTGLVVGSRVAINVGPYADVQGVLEGYAKGRTARVRMMLFGAQMVVDVRLANLARLD